ncbi:MAG TPA: hypothetical protein DCL44_12230 [Elusimicrobia bacterium]|nr:hypothetical protein [Elusimicrobiota bacterium]
MEFFGALSELIDSSKETLENRSGIAFARPGLVGYAVGTLSIFIFLRMCSLVPPGLFSFLSLLAAVLAFNFFFAGVIHLFLEMTGAPGSAVRLFSLFGVGEFFWILLLPFGFLGKLGYFNSFLGCSLCFLLVFYARTNYIGHLYLVSRNKALLAVWLPYAGIATALMAAFIYSIVWLVWMVV